MRKVLVAFGLMASLAACGDPLSGFARFSDVSTSAGTASVAPTQAEANNTGGLFGRLLNRQQDDPTNAAVEAALADAGVEPPDVEPPETGVAQTVETDETPSAPQDVEIAQAPDDKTPARGGLFGLFSRDTEQKAEVVARDAAPETGDIIAVATPAPQAIEPRQGFTLAGLFRRGSNDATPIPRTGPDATDVTPGTVLPFGQIARVCDLPRNSLGRQIENAGGFKIYDPNPSSTALRPFYITGFDDNCARTFSGAVVVTGDVQTHEFVRYQSTNARIAYTATDNAYEALKSSRCRAARGEPCGANAANLNRNTQFITVYGFFGGTFSAVPTEWAQILVHSGRVLGMSLKDG